MGLQPSGLAWMLSYILPGLEESRIVIREKYRSTLPSEYLEMQTCCAANLEPWCLRSALPGGSHGKHPNRARIETINNSISSVPES
jgi:hypothetical protein